MPINYCLLLILYGLGNELDKSRNNFFCNKHMYPLFVAKKDRYILKNYVL